MPRREPTNAALERMVKAYPTVSDVDWTRIDQRALLAISDQNRVTCLVAALPSPGEALSAEAAHHLRMVDLRRRFARAGIDRDLAFVIQTLDAVGITWLVVKGPVLADDLYPGGIREFSDLDLLVDGRDLGVAIEQLVAYGAVLAEPDIEFLSAIRSGEVAVVLPGGTVADLHWHLIHEQRVRSHYRLNMASMMARAVRHQRGDASFRTLDPTDRLLHLCLHGCLSGGERLLWAKDVDLAFRRSDWSADDLVSRAKAARVELPVALMLSRARAVLGTPVDKRLTRALVGTSLWSAVMSALVPVLRPGRSRRGTVLLRSMYRGTRATTLSTLREVARSVVYDTAWRGRSDPERPWRNRDVSDAKPGATVRAELTRYLAAVVLEASTDPLRMRSGTVPDRHGTGA